MSTPITLFDFTKNSSIKEWLIVNDGVMGGFSKGKISLTDEGHARFNGHVSLENNGGFTSVRYYAPSVAVDPKQSAILRVKGDGNEYQFRISHKNQVEYSYVATFKTSGDWETIIIPLSSMAPTYRGQKMDLPNFNFKKIEEVQFLIGNGKEQDFELLIDCIEVSDS